MNLTKILEYFSYVWGYSFNYYDTDLVIEGLKNTVPRTFFGRYLADVGCGDGTNTIKIARALKAKKVEGYEIFPSLIKTAQKKGLTVRRVTPEDNVSGDLGVLWGVVHHFSNPVDNMYQIVKNFRSFIIREPIDHWRLFEAGKRYPEKIMTEMVEVVAKKCRKKIRKVVIKKAKSVLYFIG